jgi:autotransporter-associated beta strand protein
MLNGSSLTAFPYSLTNNDPTAVWLLDPQGTGYFVRPGSPLRLDRKAQISPNQSGNGTFSTNNYATAWIDHGTAPTGTGYEYVVIPGTTSTAMSQLAADYINPSTTPYKVLERDSTAHVVQWKPDGRIGYALFRTGALSAAVTNAGPLRSVSLPCLVMTQPTNSSLWLTVVNPDLNLINNVSTPTNVDVTVAGNWNSLSGSTNASILSVNGTATVVRVRTVNGLPVEVLLDFAGPVTPTLTAPVASAIFDGQTLAASTLTGGTATIANSGTAVAGSFAFATPDILPNVGTTNVSVTFTPLDTNNFATATTNVTVTVLSPVAGATFQWDPDLANPGAQDGSGTWSVASANWLYGTNHVGWADHNVASFGVATTTNCTVTLANDVTPAGIVFAPTTGNYTLAGTHAIWTTDNPNLVVSNNAAISAPITGSGGLNNTVWGTLTISGTNSYAGGTTVTRGTINIFGDQSAAAGGWTLSSSLIGVGMTVNFNAGSAITVSSGNSIVLHNYMNSGLLDAALNVAGTVINNGMLDDNRRGNLTLNSGATWTQNGGMFIRTTSNTSQGSSLTVSDGATFTYAGVGPIGLSPANINSGSALLAIAGGTFITSQGFQNATATSTGTATILLKNGGTLKLSATIPQLTTGAPANTFVSTGAGSMGGAIDTSAYSTTISNVLTGSGSLTKLGAGMLTLTASNTFTGSLSISNGTVAVNGSLVNGIVAVAPAGTLGGTGVVDAVNVSGSIAPGNGAVGALTTAGETWNGGGAYQFGLNSATNSSGWDLLKISGALNLQSATTNRFTIRLISLTSSNTPGPLADFVSAGTNVWTLATASGDIQNFDPAKFSVDTTGFSNAFNGTFAVSTNAGSLLLIYSGAALVAPVVGGAVAGGGTFGFSFSGPTGQGYHVYSTTNLALPLVNWQTETGGVFGTGSIIYSESATSNPRKFFRVGSP